MEEINRRIAADLLIALIKSGRLQVGGAGVINELVVTDAIKLFHDLLAGIQDRTVREKTAGPT